MDCIVLAGGVPRPGEPLYSETRGGPKAMLDLAGRPLVQWVLDGLAAAEAIDRMVLVGLAPEIPVACAKDVERVGPQGRLVDNLFAGIERLLVLDPDVERAAFCWSDIPLATGPMFDRVLGAAADADVVAGLVRREALEARYPEVRENWLRVPEGQFVAADFGLFRPRAAARVRARLEELFPRRKSPLRQAYKIGLGLLLRYLVGRLTIPDLERTLEERFGILARIQVVEDPELGLDVDDARNLEICRRVLADAARPRG